MKLAFISDIHANLPALEAVLKDIQKHNPDDIFCLGDLVNFAGWDNEVIDFIRKQNITCVQGNHDEGIGNGYTQFKYSFKTEAQKEFGTKSIAYVNNTINPANRDFLKSLPFSASFEFHFSSGKVRLVLVHASPSSSSDYIFPDIPEEKLITILHQANADILIGGHTHKPFHKAILFEEGNRKSFRYFTNAGSVGKPKHGNNKACYVMLEIKENLSLAASESILVQFFYVTYEVKEVIDKIHSIGLSDAYDDFLLHGEN